jgi:hypothetical protein
MTQPSSGASAIRFNEIPGYSGIATPSSDDLLVALNVAAERNYVITLADIGPLAGVPTGFPQGAVAFGGEDGSLAHDGDSLLYDGDEGILQVGGIRSFPASVSNGDGDDLLFSAGMGDGDGDGGDIVFRSSVPGASGSGPHSPLALARLGLGGFSLDIPLPSSPGVTVRAAASQSASLRELFLQTGSASGPLSTQPGRSPILRVRRTLKLSGRAPQSLRRLRSRSGRELLSPRSEVSRLGRELPALSRRPLFSGREPRPLRTTR